MLWNDYLNEGVISWLPLSYQEFSLAQMKKDAKMSWAYGTFQEEVMEGGIKFFTSLV